jgi:hypothetical protein
MSSKSYIGAYWGPRSQSVDDCADGVAALIEQLASIDPLLTGWRQGASSKRKALEQSPVSSDHTDLVKRLLGGRNRRDDNNEIIEQLGYSIGLWNGNPNDRAAAGLSIRCGQTSSRVANNVVLNLPGPDDAPGLYKSGAAQRLLRAVIDIWKPDRAVWTNHELVDKQCEPDRPMDNGGLIKGQLVGHPAGWATYLRDGEGKGFNPALLPSTAKIEPVATGTLVMLGDTPADAPLNDVLAVRAAMGYAVPPRQEEAAAVPEVTPAASASGAPAADHQTPVRRATGDQAQPIGEASSRPKEDR